MDLENLGQFIPFSVDIFIASMVKLEVLIIMASILGNGQCIVFLFLGNIKC